MRIEKNKTFTVILIPICYHILSTECNAGYISDVGEPCHKCPEGAFGTKCAEICSCLENER